MLRGSVVRCLWCPDPVRLCGEELAANLPPPDLLLLMLLVACNWVVEEGGAVWFSVEVVLLALLVLLVLEVLCWREAWYANGLRLLVVVLLPLTRC